MVLGCGELSLVVMWIFVGVVFLHLVDYFTPGAEGDCTGDWISFNVVPFSGMDGDAGDISVEAYKLVVSG